MGRVVSSGLKSVDFTGRSLSNTDSSLISWTIAAGERNRGTCDVRFAQVQFANPVHRLQKTAVAVARKRPPPGLLTFTRTTPRWLQYQASFESVPKRLNGWSNSRRGAWTHGAEPACEADEEDKPWRESQRIDESKAANDGRMYHVSCRPGRWFDPASQYEKVALIIEASAAARSCGKKSAIVATKAIWIVAVLAESSGGLTASIRILGQFVELDGRCAACFWPPMTTADHSCVRPGSNEKNQYRPRNPEASLLYWTIAGHLESFLARQQGRGREVPQFIEREMRAYLSCEILARRLSCWYAFLRQRRGRGVEPARVKRSGHGFSSAQSPVSRPAWWRSSKRTGRRWLHPFTRYSKALWLAAFPGCSNGNFTELRRKRRDWHLERCSVFCLPTVPE